jgi:drug/metabolite transporter (DMT)-like permease
VLPFILVAWGEQHIDSSAPAIVNALGPLFIVLLALRLERAESVAGSRLGGVFAGLMGVAMLAGFNPTGGLVTFIAIGAATLATLLGAVAGFVIKKSLRDHQASVLVTATMIAASLFLLPFALVRGSGRMPDWEAVASLVALGIGVTAIGQALLFHTISLHGIYRTSLVTYLIPVAALLYGSVILDEHVTAAKIFGLGMVLVGVALGSGALGRSRQFTV